MFNPDSGQPVYWDRRALTTEFQRVLDVCHGCRRCWNLCPSFGNLFKRIDQIEDAQTSAAGGMSAAERLERASSDVKGEGRAAAPQTELARLENPVDALSEADRGRVVDDCWQCKLCYNNCPYHPPHRFALDFPRLLQRYRAVEVKEGRWRWQDTLLARADLIGRLSSGWRAALVNRLNASKPYRRLLGAVLGIHPERQLPRFHARTFRDWWDVRGPKARSQGRVALFYTCSVEYNWPGIGRAAVHVLEKNGFEVVCPPQSCCGMPFLDAGRLKSAKAAARRNVARFLPLAQQGVPIVALGPTCSYMLRQEYPSLLGSEAARVVAGAARDVNEFLVALHRKGRLNLSFSSSPASFAYQAACHLRAQNIGLKGKELLELLPGARVSVLERCTAHDGTWSMKREHFKESMDYAGKLFKALEEAQVEQVASDCPLAGLQITQGTGRPVRHPVELLAQAYGFSD
ncbi:MAG: 4Fe-4S dicluster domain-containing protein [Elusimicrobia bacterium]|nr:4Fe-4S dicluster domain-containing protein [Elusimicrobiota bacterium]MDE2425897.1 4Fe-4S dicluster domain-containing protein [Elusimicrobiota bacterium]